MVHYRDTRVKKGTKTPNPTFPNGYPGTTPYKVADNNNIARMNVFFHYFKTSSISEVNFPRISLKGAVSLRFDSFS